MEYKKQRSPHWNEYAAGKGRDAFPFNEGFPHYPYDIDKAKFELILRDGERCEASVDHSTQYRAEGLQWKVLTATSLFDVGSTIDRAIVAAWQEK